MKPTSHVNLSQRVEFSFANLFNLRYSAEDFSDMLRSVIADPAYLQEDFAYDMRSGLLYLHVDTNEIEEAPSYVRAQAKNTSQLAIHKIKILKACGLMDPFSRIILSDFCRTQSFNAKQAAHGYTPELFSACIRTAHFYLSSEDVDNHFVPSVMKLALISDAPYEVVKAAGHCGGELYDFIRVTKRQDLLPLLDEAHRRKRLEDDLGL